MTFVARVVLLLALAIQASVLYGQVVDIASDLDTAGRNFSCTGEVVTYTCSGQGNTLTINCPPLFTSNVFLSNDPVPDAVSTVPNVILTLTNRVINGSRTFYAVNLQITVLNDARIDVSCSTNATNNVAIPLIHESSTIEPPSIVTFSGDMTLSWTPPLNPQFDIDYYIVRIYVDGILNTTRSSRDNSLDIDVPGNITATVSTVSTCDKVSDSQPSDGFIIIGESTNIPILVPDNQGLIGGIVVLAILCAVFLIAFVTLALLFAMLRKTISKLKQNQRQDS
ncbi:uncharacterized protein LOC135349414 [Halichondria panicea]|uniref:uncharacterized protein LOC135349414 n=1 Tax=Halichondria panicea TaxID=6063 RepID=UPI00312B32BF